MLPLPKPDPSLPSIPWRDTFNGVRRALRYLSTPDDIVGWYCEKTNVPRSWLGALLDHPTNVVVPYLSEVKTYVLRNIDRLGLRAKAFVDLANLAGYPKQNFRKMTDDPVAWLSSPVHSSFSAGWWSEQFRVTFAASAAAPRGLVSFRDFVLSRWLWVTPGATSLSSAMLDGKLVRTKFGAAVSLSDERLLQLVFDPAPGKESDIGIFLKPDEMGYKRRLIANLPLGAYITAAYVRFLLESVVGLSPAFMKLAPTPIDGVDVISLLRAGSVAMPLDESSYDYHVTEESWAGFEAFLVSTFPGNEGVALFSSMRRRLRWVFDGQTGVWVKGMPSGLALTSYLNSWMNYIKQRSIVKDSPIHWAAGDDALVFTSMSLDTVEKEYQKFGAVVNSTKNWKATTAAEYLKVLYHRGGSTGYPARIYSSLIWAGVERQFSPVEKLNELAELWKQFYDRLGSPFDVGEVARDLVAAVRHKLVGFNQTVARQWLYTPRARGGFGKWPYAPLRFKWEAKVMSRSRYTGTVIRVPEVAKFDNSSFSFSVLPSSLGQRAFRVGPPLRLPPVTSLPEWERRLAGEDNPVSGQFRTMALDTIPLPVVDGVSTRVMSFFASFHSLNVLPNLSGGSEVVVARLVSASLHLVDAVRDWMDSRRLFEVS